MVTQSFLILMFLCALVALASGLDLRGREEGASPTAEDCMRPPTRKHGSECCRVPKERIWGDIRTSLNKCLKKMQEDPMLMRQSTDEGEKRPTPDVSEVVTPTEVPSDFGSSSNSSSDPVPGDHHPGGGHRGKKPLSERLKQLFSSVYKEIRKTLNSIWQSVVIITDHYHQQTDDSCFMECVFEDQGFLLDKMVNKDALLERLKETLGKNELWHKVAVGAVEVCYQMEMANASNSTCQSGSEKMFRCVFKQIFFNCPNWRQSNYCTSLKEFYKKCPSGPPPEMNDHHFMTTSPPPQDEEEDMESNPTTESERYSEPE